MNINSTGESSCKGRENGDASTGSERPLKKARFAWQVKGKYHMKNETDESNINLTMPSTCEPSTLEVSSTPSSSTTFDRKVDYLMKQDYSKIDLGTHNYYENSFLNNSKTNIMDSQPQYPRYISSYERRSNNTQMVNNCSNSVKTLAIDNAEDQCIAQWQARQVVKGCLDNTLNRVLESWTTDPFPSEDANPNRFLALDFAEFINHLPGDNSVENEGILMAISAHGLQNTTHNNNREIGTDHSSTSTFDIPSSLQSLSPVISDDDCQQINDSESNAEEKLPIDWQCDNQNTNDASPFAYFSESSPSYNFNDDSHLNSNTESLDIDSHFDFMNAAVLYAIKSKGLTASGTDYG